MDLFVVVLRLSKGVFIAVAAFEAHTLAFIEKFEFEINFYFVILS